MKYLRSAAIFLATYSLLLTTGVHQVRATWTEPFPPFSKEGNTTHDYFFDEIFPLFRYIQTRNFEVYENADRSRNYEDLIICPGPNADRRDQYCDNGKTEDSKCTGGEVDLCHDDPGYPPAETRISKNGNCKYDKPKNRWEEGEFVEGECEYTTTPSIARDIKGTDFATKNTSLSESGLTYPKTQSEHLLYGNIGSDNAISWGSQYLNSNACEIALRKFIVLRRAKHTKSTVDKTGEWPLGWVDWGYQLANGKTLIQVHDSLPGEISNQLNQIVESADDFYLTGGNTSIVTDVSSDKKQVCDSYTQFQAMSPPPAWVNDLSFVPMYPPSFRQGYVRPSICVWDECCPGNSCPVPTELLRGNRRGLYYDLSISQAYNGALDEFFLSYNLDEGVKIFKQLVTKNPLIRYLSSTSEKAIPSRINAELTQLLKGTCVDYVPWSNWNTFGTHMDYLDSSSFLDPLKKCPDYSLMPEVNKETADARVSAGFSTLVNLIWGAIVDDVEPIKYHFLSIPDAMGQSFQEVKQPFYDTRDTLRDLEAIADFNLDQSNIVDDDADHLYGGKSMDSADPRRRWGYLSCSDPMFSSQTETSSVEAYALGTRVGCETSEVPEGKCDGQLFAKLIEGSKYTETSPKGQDYFNTNIKSRLTAELMNTYAAAEKETGVPCEILAGIHFVEADNNPDGSLVSGRRIGTEEPDAGGRVYDSLLETAVYAGEHLKGKVGGNLNSIEKTITALSRYNGGGNSNCQLGYPYPIPYTGCPRAFEGEDDPYPVNWIDNKHNTMYLLYCADRTACAPQVWERPGALTVAINVYNSMTKGGYDNSSLPSPTPTSAKSAASQLNGVQQTGFFPKSCGPNTLSTALGCLPYERAAFISSLVRFIVGISGAISLMVMLYSVIQIMTAGGNTEQLKKGRELFASAVAGLLFLIFAVSLLRLFAADILQLPGF